jgi:hypothetical protein
MPQLVLRYGDNLVIAQTLVEAETVATRRLPDLPIDVFEENDDCEPIREFGPVIKAGAVVLVAF